MFMPSSPVITISELNHRVRLTLERSMPSVWVAGEISNLSRAPSGHWYFTLKDSGASARCVMFRNRNQFVDWLMREGDKVELRAQASLYEPRGDYQLFVEAIRRAGQGDLYEAFLRIKESLRQEGLFEPGKKRPIHPMPRRIALVTSLQAAALEDVLTTLARRWPLARIVILPCPVQGEKAAERIEKAIQVANTTQQFDTLLLVRGGGSIEDLWAFNNESLARTIAASAIPVVTGIGHETDFTIADFVADQRGPTPTGAAELATPSQEEILSKVRTLRTTLANYVRTALETAWQRLDSAIQRLRHPSKRLELQKRDLHHLRNRLLSSLRHQQQLVGSQLTASVKRLFLQRPDVSEMHRMRHQLMQRHRMAFENHLSHIHRTLAQLTRHIATLNPANVLERGYCITHRMDGTVVASSKGMVVGQPLAIQFSDGEIRARVEKSQALRPDQ